jgi:hypothetical protein
MEPFGDLTEGAKQFIIAVIDELDKDEYKAKDKFRAVHQMTKGRWAFDAGGKPFHLSVPVDESILDELEAQEYIRYTLDGVVRVYRIMKKARVQYELHIAPPPDSDTRSETPEFSFMADPQLRSMIERDYREIQPCLTAGAYKAATVMCGSVMEALLLDALLTRQTQAKQCLQAPKTKGKVVKDLRKWPLSGMIAVAQELRILPTTILGMSDSLREYRNLIHPAVEIRKQITPEEEEATLAHSALRVIIKNLS